MHESCNDAQLVQVALHNSLTGSSSGPSQRSSMWAKRRRNTQPSAGRSVGTPCATMVGLFRSKRLTTTSPYQWLYIDEDSRTSMPAVSGARVDSIPVSRVELKHSLVAKKQVEASAATRVLIIDDDDVARELLSSTLKQAGHQVIELASAIGATRAIFEHDVDAVVVDVMLPDISGDKLARVLRENSRGQWLGIVLVSSRPVQELQELAAGARADGVVAKANIRSGLVATVARAVQRRAQRVAAPR